MIIPISLSASAATGVVAAAHQSGQCAARGRGAQKLRVAALCLNAAGDLRLANTSDRYRSILRGQSVAGAPG